MKDTLVRFREKDIGLIRPMYNRWRFPLSHMEVGDFFTVLHEDRDPENLRALIGVRAAQLGRRFSVERNYMPGVARVMRVEDWGQEPDVDVIKERTDYQAMRAIVIDHYGPELDMNGKCPPQLSYGERPYKWPFPAIKPLPRQRHYVIPFIDDFAHIRLDEDGVYMEAIGHGKVASDFIKAEVEELMS